MTSALLASIEWSQGIEDAWSEVAAFVPKLIGFLLVLLIGYFIAKAIANIADTALERVGFDNAVERGGVKTGSREVEVRRVSTSWRRSSSTRSSSSCCRWPSACSARTRSAT